MTLVGELHSTLTTQFAHEGIQRVVVAHAHRRHASTLADLVHGLEGGHRGVVAARGRTAGLCRCLSIHQIDVGQTHPREVDVILVAPAVAIVELVAVEVDELIE